MSLLTTLLYPKRTATPPPKAVRRICMERVVVHDGTPATAFKEKTKRGAGGFGSTGTGVIESEGGAP